MPRLTRNLLLALPVLGLGLASPALAGDCRSCDREATPLQAVTAEMDIVDTAVAAGSFETLAALLEAADLVDVLKGEGPFTVFAPTDEAFAQLPQETVDFLLDPENKHILQAVLLYHVVPGALEAEDVLAADKLVTVNGQKLDLTAEGSVMIDNATVTATDIGCTNGVVHVIDTVLVPNTNDLIETAVGAGSFETLAAALDAAGLIEALQGEGPFTVFAPTDEAFAALPEGVVADLLKPENKDRLIAVLTYHVVAGQVYAVDAIAAEQAETLQGSSVTIEQRNGDVFIDGARVIHADIDTTNGVIHVIDQVILPAE
ncbi:MAG: fasciclin domain-containing protein [Phycisphaerales bacterium JB063]